MSTTDREFIINGLASIPFDQGGPVIDPQPQFFLDRKAARLVWAVSNWGCAKMPCRRFGVAIEIATGFFKFAEPIGKGDYSFLFN